LGVDIRNSQQGLDAFDEALGSGFDSRGVNRTATTTA
jgi:hypothetical protein